MFPSAYGVFGADSDLWTAKADAGQRAYFDGFGVRDGAGWFLALPWDVTMHAAAFGGSLGLAYLILVPLAVRRRPARPLLLTALFCAGYLVLWASPPSSLQLRFVVPALGALAVVAAAGFEVALSARSGVAPAAGALLAAVVLVALALALPPFVGLHDRDGEGTLTHVLRETPVDVVSGAEPEPDYIARRVPAYRRSGASTGSPARTTESSWRSTRSPTTTPSGDVPRLLPLPRPGGLFDGGARAAAGACGAPGTSTTCSSTARIPEQWSFDWLAHGFQRRALERSTRTAAWGSTACAGRRLATRAPRASPSVIAAAVPAAWRPPGRGCAARAAGRPLAARRAAAATAPADACLARYETAARLPAQPLGGPQPGPVSSGRLEARRVAVTHDPARRTGALEELEHRRLVPERAARCEAAERSVGVTAHDQVLAREADAG